MNLQVWLVDCQLLKDFDPYYQIDFTPWPMPICPLLDTQKIVIIDTQYWLSRRASKSQTVPHKILITHKTLT
jgi:hypothetical protein